MKCYLISLGIISIIIFGKSHITDGIPLPLQSEGKSLLAQYLVGIATIDDLPIEPELPLKLPSAAPAAILIDGNQQIENLKRPRQELLTTMSPQALKQHAVDNIEDAILAALELAAKEQEQIPNQNNNLKPNPVGTNQQNVVPGHNKNQQGLVNGQFLQLAGIERTTREPAPGEYIAGIFGNLASANLAGTLDNSLKLISSSGVQNFFTGLVDTVTCQISNGCTDNTDNNETKTQ